MLPFTCEEIQNDFINYPHVALVTDLNGDTIASGGLEFFGQFGNSTQIYSPLTNLTSLPPNFSGLVYFVYDNDTCILSFPCPWVGVPESSNAMVEFDVFPNPAKDRITLVGKELDLLQSNFYFQNIYGQRWRVSPTAIDKDQWSINLTSFSNGIYLLVSMQEKKFSYKKIEIIR